MANFVHHAVNNHARSCVTHAFLRHYESEWPLSSSRTVYSSKAIKHWYSVSQLLQDEDDVCLAMGSNFFGFERFPLHGF